MTNSADPDQLASSENSILLIHCLLRQGMSCSAREGLNYIINEWFRNALRTYTDRM